MPCRSFLFLFDAHVSSPHIPKHPWEPVVTKLATLTSSASARCWRVVYQPEALRCEVDRQLLGFENEQAADGPMSMFFLPSSLPCFVRSFVLAQVKLVSAEDLESTRKELETVTSVHVYSVQAVPCSQSADVSTQVQC